MTSHIDRRIRKATAAAAVVVALCSAVLSYSGLCALALASGFHRWQAWMLPIAIDGLVICGMLGVLHAALSKTSAAYSWMLIALGLVASVIGNALNADTISSAVVHAAPSLALALSLEALVSSLRRKVVDGQAAEQAQARAEAAEERRQQRATQRASNPVPARPEPSEGRKRRVTITPEIAAQVLELHGKGSTYRDIESALNISRSAAARVITTAAA